ncbi:hypothetical protein J2S74_000349 [Evansella vedderi]|uniref:Uncharacterized protein n=1 Tax=Evansella vedderi TaxID=38282 RepID=A0ABT9ZP16_9BACI|nr:hypothetical protein [Evansella vedderi]
MPKSTDKFYRDEKKRVDGQEFHLTVYPLVFELLGEI